MKFSTLAVAAMASLPFTNAYYKGFNMPATNAADGSCKTQAQWQAAFKKLQAAPGDFTSVRVYAASDCNTLEYAAPAAVATGTKLLVGIWTEDSAHYAAEKQALLNAIAAHGHSWILAISVGSEDLYRGDTTPSELASQIYDVRGMVRAKGVEAEVGHVDTWTAWVNASNNAVIEAADFVGMDGYPYFQGSSIESASTTFWNSVTETRDAVNAVSPGKWVWVTETGWPVSGAKYGAAVASVKNAQTYWRSVACAAFKQVHIFWYVDQDYNETPSFGMFGKDGKSIYDLYVC